MFLVCNFISQMMLRKYEIVRAAKNHFYYFNYDDKLQITDYCLCPIKYSLNLTQLFSIWKLIKCTKT